MSVLTEDTGTWLLHLVPSHEERKHSQEPINKKILIIYFYNSFSTFIELSILLFKARAQIASPAK